MPYWKARGYQPQPGPRPDPPRTSSDVLRNLTPDELRDMSAAKKAWTDFQIYFIKRRERMPDSSVRSSFFAGWHARKRADHIMAYGGDYAPKTADPRIAESVLRTILAEGPVAVEKIRELAGFAGVAWPAILRAANKIATPWRWPCVSVTHWELRDPESDFDSFLDAGIPNG
jgi:hypothetical protein